MPAIDDLRDLLDRQRRAIERSEPGVRDGADPENLHRFRVASRRTRALIRASRPLVRDQLATLDRELRWLGGITGPVRDLDVLIEHLRGLVPRARPGPGRRRVDHRRAGARAAPAAGRPAHRDRHEPLPRAAAAIRVGRSLPRVSDASVSLARLARKELDRLRAEYDDLGENPNDDDLHAVRIHAKHARYSAELAATADGEAFERLADSLSKVQDVIGEHQDAVVAELRVRALASDESRLAAGGSSSSSGCGAGRPAPIYPRR